MRFYLCDLFHPILLVCPALDSSCNQGAIGPFLLQQERYLGLHTSIIILGKDQLRGIGGMS